MTDEPLESLLARLEELYAVEADAPYFDREIRLAFPRLLRELRDLQREMMLLCEMVENAEVDLSRQAENERYAKLIVSDTIETGIRVVAKIRKECDALRAENAKLCKVAEAAKVYREAESPNVLPLGRVLDAELAELEENK